MIPSSIWLPAGNFFSLASGILVRHASPEKHRRHRQGDEHHLHGDVPAHDGRKLSRWQRSAAKGAKFEARFRGAHVLQRDENGLEKCVACFLCAANCPSNCIYIEAADNTAEHRVSGAERYAKVYNIDYNRCIFCGYCVEACPTDAITHGHGFELASFNASNLVYRKEQMLASRPAHMGANVVFNQADVDGGAPKEMVAGS